MARAAFFRDAYVGFELLFVELAFLLNSDEAERAFRENFALGETLGELPTEPLPVSTMSISCCARTTGTLAPDGRFTYSPFSPASQGCSLLHGGLTSLLGLGGVLVGFSWVLDGSVLVLVLVFSE